MEIKVNKLSLYKILAFTTLLCCCSAVFALVFPLPSSGDNIVGKVQWTQSLPGDTFITIGRRYDIGYFEIVEANPGIDPNLPHPGTLLVIPSRFVIPNDPRTGVIVNLAELRVYYFPPGTNKLVTYPVGIGREGWNTPVGTTTIIARVANPTWVVPPDIKADRAKNGIDLPDSVAPGPNNPLGMYALYLGFPGYRMHGTNDPTGIGRRSSSGCIRMWPEDIEELFELTKVGTPVRVINDPYKAGWSGSTLYLESHTPLQEQQVVYTQDPTLMTMDIKAATANRPATIDWDAAKRIADQENGIPQIVGTSAQ
jgi:L,D-transpeptidase ErfK/SrfK